MTHTTRLCFLGNQTRTNFFREVAAHIDRDRTRVTWIVVNAAQRDALVAEYGADEVLYLPLSTPERGSPFEIKINDLLFSDRRLKHIKPRGLRYLRAIQAPIAEFLSGDLPTLVVGELTYSYELVTYRITQQVLTNCHWASLFHTRIPSNHFAFFSDEAFSREAWCVPAPLEVPADASESGSDDITYRQLNRNISAHFNSSGFYLAKLRRFITRADYDPEDPTLKSNNRTDKLVKNSSFMLNRISYHWMPKADLEAIDECKGRTVIFPMHLQPEANIDTCGRYWENQAETVLKIWRQLGPEDFLFIKEHPVAIGNRGYSWYRRLLAYPNIKLLHHSLPVHEILRRIDYVFTIAGTMGMEAALAGGKVLCLAPTSYDRLENVVSPTIGDFRHCRGIDDLYDTLRARKRDGWSGETYQAHINAHAFPGDAAGDLNANPASWSDSNLKLVAQALTQVLVRIQPEAGLRPSTTSYEGYA